MEFYLHFQGWEAHNLSWKSEPIPQGKEGRGAPISFPLPFPWIPEHLDTAAPRPKRCSRESPASVPGHSHSSRFSLLYFNFSQCLCRIHEAHNPCFPTFPAPDVLRFPEIHLRGVFWDPFSLPHPIPLNLHDFPFPMTFPPPRHWHGIKFQSFLKSRMGIPRKTPPVPGAALAGRFQRQIPEADSRGSDSTLRPMMGETPASSTLWNSSILWKRPGQEREGDGRAWEENSRIFPDL